ncbi:hypothetical protein [Vibrio vulnificus]|uniref:hypothetical protein n=1 Tax=Vibrio vulnificus TaxID=672 RepID=UPI0015947252|nr:hypothetical protein [Vibrio vulnificus]NVC72607.1 hypothetical protein [Vibrio vulnificus]
MATHNTLWLDDEVVNAFNNQPITQGINMTPYTQEPVVTQDMIDEIPEANTSYDAVTSATSGANDYSQYEVLKVDGTTHNLVTDEEGVDTTSPAEKNGMTNELTAALQTGDPVALQRAHERNMELMGKTGFDYGLQTEKDGWKTALASLGTTGLLVALAKRRGADDVQLANMAGAGLTSAAQVIKHHQDRMERQGNIDYLVAQGYLPEDIKAWLSTGNSDDLINILRNRPHAEARKDQIGHFSKGETLPDGSKAKKDGSYQTFYTFTQAGLPQVASVEYIGDLAQKNLQTDQALKVAQLQFGYDQLAAQTANQASTQQKAQLEQANQVAKDTGFTVNTLDLINDLYTTGESRSGFFNRQIGEQATGTIESRIFTVDENIRDFEGQLEGLKSSLQMIGMSEYLKGNPHQAQVEAAGEVFGQLDLRNSWTMNKSIINRATDDMVRGLGNAFQYMTPQHQQQFINELSNKGMLKTAPNGTTYLRVAGNNYVFD